jgi:hypothetical protein
MYWLLFSPSPLNESTFSSLPLFPADWMDELAEESCSFFINLDAEPQKLLLFLESSNTYRMGVYAEKLMAFFFSYFEGTRLVLTNHQLFSENRTLGEVDFVFEWKDRYIHLELCVKYYLACKNSIDFSAWIGPSGKDNLSLKLDKVKFHQLPISKSEEFIESTGLTCSSFLFMKGMFFTHNGYCPQWKNPELDFRRYYTMDTFISNCVSYNDYLLLKPPNWMAALYADNDDCKQLPTGNKELHQLLNKYNCLHLWYRKEQKTIMIVKDNWPNLVDD